MSVIARDESGEPTIWWRRQKLSKRSARAWLFTPNNTFGAEWVFLPKRFSYTFQVTHMCVGTSAVKFTLSIPFLVTLYLSIQRWDWLTELFSLTPERRGYGDLTRKIGITWTDGALHIYPWCEPDSWKKGKRNVILFDPLNFFLGRQKYNRRSISNHESFIEMPEGRYPCTIELFEATWKRPRWPFPKRILRADTKVEGGIPIPGKGDNSWDMEDDAIYSMVAPAGTIGDAIQVIRSSAMRDRERYATVDWVPSEGWPEHCEGVAE